jgi:hypothetical protein
MPRQPEPGVPLHEIVAVAAARFNRTDTAISNFSRRGSTESRVPFRVA